MTKKEKEKHKRIFKESLKKFVNELKVYVSSDDDQWTVKGFIDIYKNIYTISSDTKIVSKILEIHLFPEILKFAEEFGYSIVLAEKQNWYPDLTFIKIDNENVKFALDLKTSYREPNYPKHINGFTLGSHGTYFKNRNSTKNIQFPYSQYIGHFCLGIIYTRADSIYISETEIVNAEELKDKKDIPQRIGARQVTKVKNLKSITSVIKDFDFFVKEKWEIASDRSGSHNTANIGSITKIDDIKKGNGVFAKLGEKWFDEYWMNYGNVMMMKNGKSKKISRLEDFLEFKGKNKNLVNKMATKRMKKVKNENNSTAHKKSGD